MSQSAYSWMGTRLHFVLEDDVATAYNDAQRAFFKAQKDHEILHGRKWNPVDEAIWINWTEEQNKAWDDIAKLINLLVEINGGSLSITEEEMTSDYLEKL